MSFCDEVRVSAPLHPTRNHGQIRLSVVPVSVLLEQSLSHIEINARLRTSMDSLRTWVTIASTLRTLKIRFDYSYSEDLGERARIDDDRYELDCSLGRFFERSCAHLETLELIDIPFSQTSLISHLKFSPSLSSLDIRFDSRWYTIDETLLRELDVNRPKHILPRLCSLSLRGLANLVPTGELLDALIASRRHINPDHHEVALLENLTLECDFLQLESEYPQFQRFVSEGLNIIYGKGVEISTGSCHFTPTPHVLIPYLPEPANEDAPRRPVCIARSGSRHGTVYLKFASERLIELSPP
ncbi:hypothetical protein BD779DRAFT_1804927 [Infundibulicybe gibba]|nr:hypothetical protein BD779DRAFT_1804927 [Infundibulicybe gibba]